MWPVAPGVFGAGRLPAAHCWGSVFDLLETRCVVVPVGERLERDRCPCRGARIGRAVISWRPHHKKSYLPSSWETRSTGSNFFGLAGKSDLSVFRAIGLSAGASVAQTKSQQPDYRQQCRAGFGYCSTATLDVGL